MSKQKLGKKGLQAEWLSLHSQRHGQVWREFLLGIRNKFSFVCLLLRLLFNYISPFLSSLSTLHQISGLLFTNCFCMPIGICINIQVPNCWVHTMVYIFRSEHLALDNHLVSSSLERTISPAVLWCYGSLNRTGASIGLGVFALTSLGNMTSQPSP